MWWWHVIFIVCGKYCRNDANNSSAQDTLGSEAGVQAEDKDVCFSHCVLRSLMSFASGG